MSTRIAFLVASMLLLPCSLASAQVTGAGDQITPSDCSGR
jgi:hypothetical protein